MASATSLGAGENMINVSDRLGNGDAKTGEKTGESEGEGEGGEGELASFPIPQFHPNLHGWGPTTVPDQFVGIPFNPFSKNERIGKAADFLPRPSYHGGYNDNRGNSSYGRGGGGSRSGQGSSSSSSPYDDDDENEEAFSLVDTVRKSGSGYNRGFKPRGGRGGRGGFGRGRGGFRGRGGRGGGNFRGGANSRGGSNAYGDRGGVFAGQGATRGEEETPVIKGKKAKFLVDTSRRGKQWKAGNTGRGGRYNNNNTMTRDTSVKVRSNWKIVEQFDMAQLSKMQLKVPVAEDIAFCGKLHPYAEKIEKANTRRPEPLRKYEDINFQYVTTLEDPVLEDLIQQKAGTVFATDELLAHLMTCTRSVLPWDIVFTRVENMLFIDKREDSNLELLTVNETATDTPDENSKTQQPYNDPEKLRIEATAINQNYLCQSVMSSDQTAPVKEYDNPNPFIEEDEDESKAAPVAYRYRKWQLGDHTLIARTELHGYQRKKDADLTTTVYTLNEWDSKLSGSVDWRQKLDSQPGAVLATELKNNSAKLARWTAQTLISGADRMNIGFVSRASPWDPLQHQILSSRFYKPQDFSVQINLAQNNMWGVVKSIIDFMTKQEPGKYVLLRDPNKPVLRVYSVPMNTFDAEDEDEDDDEGMSDGGDFEQTDME